METPSIPEMIEAIHTHVKKSDRVVRHRGGYPVYMRYIGVCPVHAYTEDNGWTHGIYCTHLIHAFNTEGQGSRISVNDEETLISLYRLMTEGITSPNIRN